MTTEPTSAPAASESIPPKPTTDDPTWALRTDYLLLGLLLILSFFLASFTASNSDLWQHLAIGKRISDGKFEFGVDPYSWATDGVPWIHHAWLYSWLVYQIHETSLGGPVLVFLKAILFTLAIGLLSRIGWNAPNRWFLIICLLMAALAASSRLLLDPIVISLLFLAITLYVLDRAGVFALFLPSPPGRGAGGEGVNPTRCLWCLPPLFALWANLDAWFILGPMMLGLCWAAAGLSRWFVGDQGMPTKTLGLVFGVSILACLLNPYHVYVFQLPAELAYLVLALADPMHLPLPDGLVAGGRTLKELRRVEPRFSATMPSIFTEYWWDTRFGKNIAGIAFYPLLLLGLLAFTLVALVKPQKGAPSFHVGRFLLWLVFAVMALALYRLIPFFVLVAAPLTAMTLGEFLLWQQTSAAIPIARRDRGIKMARLVSVPFFLLLLYLAWPGWLHGPTEFNSRRRVAWQVRPDASLQKAALTLQALKESGEGQNVFNADREFANYLPWFAPDVKYGMDSRFALYAAQVAPLGKVREALNGETQDVDWQRLFMEHDIDQIAMVNFTSHDNLGRVKRWWAESGEWRQRYGDGRLIVFSRAAPGRPWPVSIASDDLNRQAFGAVPTEKRPPAHGTLSPQTQGVMALYLEGVGPTPIGLSEIGLLQVHAYNFDEAVRNHAKSIDLVSLGASLAGLQGVPGGGMTMDTAFATLYVSWQLTGWIVKSGDHGPPATPVLCVRIARQTVAENPLEVNTHLGLMSVNEVARRQEDRLIGFQAILTPAQRPDAPWIAFQPLPHSPLRDRMRQIQQIVCAYHAVQLQPDSYFHHDRLAELYLQQHLFDLALEHRQFAAKALEAERPGGAEAAKKFDAYAKQYRDKTTDLDKSIKQHLSKWKEISVGKPAFDKAYLAYNAAFLGEPLGLGKKALEVLESVETEALAPEELIPFVRLNYDLLLSMGLASKVAESLNDERVRKKLPANVHAEYQFLAAGALGDYDTMDQALTTIRSGLKAHLAEVGARRHQFVLQVFAAGTQQNTSGSTVAMRMFPAVLLFQESYNGQKVLTGELCNNLTLHGIILLEAGNTKKARARFQQAMTEGEDAPFFTERPIARRYLELLNQQNK